jgi:hypothetical protein
MEMTENQTITQFSCKRWEHGRSGLDRPEEGLKWDLTNLRVFMPEEGPVKLSPRSSATRLKARFD